MGALVTDIAEDGADVLGSIGDVHHRTWEDGPGICIGPPQVDAPDHALQFSLPCVSETSATGRVRMPVFPLNTAVVPGLILPLHIFELRYRRMIADLLMVQDPDAREFALVSVREGHDADVDGLGAVYDIGVTVRLREIDELEDGCYDIVTTGYRRFRLHDLMPDLSHAAAPPLLIGEIEYLDDADAGTSPAMAQEALRRFRIYRALLSGQLDGELIVDATGAQADVDMDDEQLPSDPAVIGYLIIAAMVIPTTERQQLLEFADAADRLRAVTSLLRRENALIAHLGALPALDLSIGNGSPN